MLTPVEARKSAVAVLRLSVSEFSQISIRLHEVQPRFESEALLQWSSPYQVTANQLPLHFGSSAASISSRMPVVFDLQPIANNTSLIKLNKFRAKQQQNNACIFDRGELDVIELTQKNTFTSS